jgi:membrane associated rhomboid family serine protease
MTTILDDIRNAFKRYDNSVVQLILINVIIFALFQIVSSVLFFAGNVTFEDTIVRNLSLPASLYQLSEKPWTLFSYFFFHKGWLHIIFNMFFLYWFGQIIAEFLGHKRLIAIYITGGLVGGITFLAAYNLIPVFSSRVGTNILLGASGAVYAVVLAAATLVPNYTFNLILLGPVKIAYIAAFYVLLSFADIRTDNPGGNLAHIGGAVAGFVFIRQLRRGSDMGKWIYVTLEMFSNVFKPKPIKRVVKNYNSPEKAFKSNPKPDDEEIDAILDKINKSGYESLSREEKEKLFQASQKD